MTHVDHGWRHAPKALGGTDPIPASPGDGIQFEVSPQVGEWLEIATTGVSPGDSPGILLRAAGGYTLIQSDGAEGSALVVDNSDGSELLAQGIIVNVETASANAGSVAEGVRSEVLADAGDAVALVADAASASGNVFPIQAFANGVKVFEIDADGNIHIKTGSAVIDDL